MEQILIIKFKENVDIDTTYLFGNNPYILIDSIKNINKIISDNLENVLSYEVLNLSSNKLMNLMNYNKTKARIEPGAIIRDGVKISDDAIILMGAVVNVGAVIGSRTMVDMNAVIGSKAIIKSNCHIGAGAVIAGVLEPVSAYPVIIEDNVFVGANAVILEGVHIMQNAVIGAGCVVTKDVPANTVIYSKQDIIYKDKECVSKIKTALNEELRL